MWLKRTPPKRGGRRGSEDTSLATDSWSPNRRAPCPATRPTAPAGRPVPCGLASGGPDANHLRGSADGHGDHGIDDSGACPEPSRVDDGVGSRRVPGVGTARFWIPAQLIRQVRCGFRLQPEGCVKRAKTPNSSAFTAGRMREACEDPQLFRLQAGRMREACGDPQLMWLPPSGGRMREACEFARQPSLPAEGGSRGVQEWILPTECRGRRRDLHAARSENWPISLEAVSNDRNDDDPWRPCCRLRRSPRFSGWPASCCRGRQGRTTVLPSPARSWR